MDQSLERRQYARVHLRAYGAGKDCDVVLGAERRTMDLVDISPGGARVRLSGLLPEKAGPEVSLSVCSVQDDGRLQNLSATIRWLGSQEMGIEFEQELQASRSDLQRLVS